MSDALAPQYVHGVYIPSALLIVGTAIVKKEWVPFALVIAALLGGWKVYSNRTCAAHHHSRARRLRDRSNCPPPTDRATATEARKVLKPDVFQEFELTEKTVLSHNTAM